MMRTHSWWCAHQQGNMEVNPHLPTCEVTGGARWSFVVLAGRRADPPPGVD